MNKIIVLLFTLSVVAFAQQMSVERIKNSGHYYYGTGSAIIEQEATDEALSELTKSIAVRVSSEFNRDVIETSKDVNETVKSILNTYSLATITNHEKIVTPVNGKIEVFVYLHKSEVVKLFESRKKLVYDIYAKALQYETASNLGYALKSYYFAIILMNSVPGNELMLDGKNLITEIPFRINEILNKTKFSLRDDKKISDNEREVIFKVSYSGKPVQLIEFTFWDGSGQVQIRGIDGECVVRLLGSSINFDRLSVDIKYSYYESRDEIKEVGELWNLVIKPSFNFSKQVSLDKTSIDNEEKKESKDIREVKGAGEESKIAKDAPAGKKDFYSDKGSYKLNLTGNDSCGVIKEIGDGTLKLLEILKEGSIPEIEKYFSYDTFLKDKISRIVKYNNPAIVGDSIYAEVNKTLTGWELRKIRIVTRYKAIKKQSSEYIILDFNNEGKLDDITFGVLENVYNTVQDQAKFSGDWISRQTIMKFVEKYRTSFLCRDLSTIDSLFADEAVIIIGRNIKKTTIKDGYKYFKIADEQPDASYIKLTKDQYLNNLSKLFKKAEDLFIGYGSMDIVGKNGTNVYGISMRQNYFTNNYSDEGYLFLLIDFGQTQPRIYIRSWQPKEWNEQSLIKLSNFNLNK
ncbi:MAG: hypothetical protein WCJ01_08720 [Ignavibacteria bacterium]